MAETQTKDADAPAKEGPWFLRVHTPCSINRVDHVTRMYEPGDEVSSTSLDSREPWLQGHATRHDGEADPNKDSALLKSLQRQQAAMETAVLPLADAKTTPAGEETTETRDEAAEKAGEETAKQVAQARKEIKQGHRDPPPAEQPKAASPSPPAPPPPAPHAAPGKK